jgi:hypothetical protein
MHAFGDASSVIRRLYPISADDTSHRVSPGSWPRLTVEPAPRPWCGPIFCAPCALTILLRTGSHPLIMSITIYDAKWSHVRVVPWVTLNVMSLHTFEAL